MLLVAIGPLPSDLPPGCRVVGAVARKSPDHVQVIAGPYEPVPELLTDARAVLETPHQTWQMAVEWDYSAHAVIEVDDGVEGPPLIAEFAVDDRPPDRVPTALAGFTGEILGFDELPVAPPEGLDICAGVWVGDEGQQRLYVNAYARCDHEHLVPDVRDLVSAFNDSGPDAGWTRLDGLHAGWISAMATEAAADRHAAPKPP